MFGPLRQNRGLQFLRTAADSFRVSEWTLNRTDLDGLRYVAIVSVWVHWFMDAMCFVQLVYRPWYGPERYGLVRAAVPGGVQRIPSLSAGL